MENKSTWYFLKPGLQTTIQDNGRSGHQHFGVPVGGALDRSSVAIANKLLNNKPDNPVLEITLVGPKIEINGACQIAITGADLSPQINERSVPLYESIEVQDDSVLSFGNITKGCRTYIAIKGDWQIKKWLGSYSTVGSFGNEILPDSFIRKGSRLTIHSTRSALYEKFINKLRPDFKETIKVKVIPGPEFENFTKIQIAWFFSQTFSITPNSNRMGYLLDKSIINFQPTHEVISSGVIPGTIQITNSGLPIILMADAQTTGGYHRIANVIAADLDRLGQLKPGDKVGFEIQSEVRINE